MKRPKAVLWQNTPAFIDTFITYAKLANHGVKLVNSQNHEEFLNSLWCQEGLSLKVPMFKVFKHLYFWLIFSRNWTSACFCPICDRWDQRGTKGIQKKPFGSEQSVSGRISQKTSLLTCMKCNQPFRKSIIWPWRTTWVKISLLNGSSTLL